MAVLTAFLYCSSRLHLGSAVIDGPSEASGLWGRRVWPLQRWVDQRLRRDWLPTWSHTQMPPLTFSCIGITQDAVHMGWTTIKCICVYCAYIPKQPIDAPYLSEKAMTNNQNTLHHAFPLPSSVASKTNHSSLFPLWSHSKCTIWQDYTHICMSVFDIYPNLSLTPTNTTKCMTPTRIL